MSEAQRGPAAGGPPPDNLLRDPTFRRLWLSVLISTFGGQVTMLALPLTAALLLHASPSQMGLLTAVETLPFVLLSLPAGVWLDRVRKLPLYIGGELALALAVLSVPLAWWAGWLSMGWLYGVGLVIGTVSTLAGSAAQIVLSQVVDRSRLVEAHGKNGLAHALAEVTGPGAAGLLVKLLGAPLALLADALMLVCSALILTGLKVHEQLAPRTGARFWPELREGLRFVLGHRLLVALALLMGGWQFCNHAVQSVQVLHATRGLGLSEQAIGLCFAGMGLGAIVASSVVHRLSQRHGPGPTLLAGIGLCGVAWLLPWWLPSGPAGVAAYAAMLVLAGAGGVMAGSNFLGLRQAVTPAPLLGRMTTSMRWLVLLPAGPGALAGGWLAEHAGLRSTLLGAGMVALLALLLSAWAGVLPAVRHLPDVHTDPPPA